MFNAIKGILVDRTFDAVRVETVGIEWDIAVPATMVDEFGPIGSETKAFVHLQHREDIMKLFGFPTEHDRSHFLELIRVDGIGPKQALRIMSGIRSDALAEAIETEDIAALERVPGVGKKTAQKIILALKGRLALSAGAGKDGSGADADVIAALVDMGFDRKAVERAVKTAAKTGVPDERELFRVALMSLTGGS
ncbi:MAG: Holliday junction branch migration protein RuvA [Spirochaetes bacterium]|nr:Holliday junction branch migration protein RuvA [Spirochaetota bacterium]